MFEGGLYGTSLQFLTLVIWGACRTSEGPGFEPLIGKASECDPFEGEETPEGILYHDSRTTRSRESCARVFRWLWATWPDSCGAVRCGRAFSGGSLGQTKRRGRRLTDGIVQQSRRARRLPCRSYRCVRAWETLRP